MKSLCKVVTYEYKIKAQELFQLWTYRKGEHSNIKSAYFQNTGIWM